MVDDQAKAIADLKAEFPIGSVHRNGTQYGGNTIHEAIDRAISISRASQGSGVETPLRDAAQSLVDEGFSKGKDSRHGWEMDGERAYLVDACAFDALSEALKKIPDVGSFEWDWGAVLRNEVNREQAALRAALSPPATPQAPEDVRERAIELLLDMEKGLPHTIPRFVNALADAHLLATPVTVTMERVEEFCGMLGLAEPPYDDIAEFMMTYFGIQISGQSEGPK